MKLTIVFIVGLVVLLGWFFNIDFIKAINTNWPSMKISTSIFFMLSSIGIYIKKFLYNEKILYSILFFMTCLMFYNFGIYLEMSITDTLNKNDEVKTVIKGMPSLGTFLNFLLIIIFSCYNQISDKVKKYLSLTIINISAVALLGYILNIPFLYYYIEGTSTGMAIHTAVLFILIGIEIYNYDEINIVSGTDS